MSGPATVARLTSKMATDALKVSEVIRGRRPGDAIEVRRSEKIGRSSGVPRPVELRSIEWEDAQRRDAGQLLRLLRDPNMQVPSAVQILARLDQDPPGPDLDALAAAIAGEDANPDTARWRTAVVHLENAWHEAADAIHDGWTALYTARYAVDDRGLTVLNQTVETAALAVIKPIRGLADDLDRLVRRLTPARIRVCNCSPDCRRPLEPGATRPTRDDCRQRISREKRRTNTA